MKYLQVQKRMYTFCRWKRGEADLQCSSLAIFERAKVMAFIDYSRSLESVGDFPYGFSHLIKEIHHFCRGRQQPVAKIVHCGEL